MFYVNDIEKQAQYIKLFKEYDIDAIILNTPIDNNFMSFLEYKGAEGVKFARVDSDISDVLKDDVEEVSENNDKIIEVFKNAIKDKVKEVKVQKLKKEGTPAMVLISEESRRMAEMQKQFGMQGLGDMNFNDEKTLVLNDNNPIIKKVVELSENEDNNEKINKICNQILDLALISGQNLDANGLEEFISRSNELLLLVI